MNSFDIYREVELVHVILLVERIGDSVLEQSAVPRVTGDAVSAGTDVTELLSFCWKLLLWPLITLPLFFFTETYTA